MLGAIKSPSTKRAILAIGMTVSSLGIVALLVWMNKTAPEGERSKPEWAEMIQQLSDAHPESRRNAARELGDLGLEAMDAVPNLLESLKDSDSGVRFEAALALIVIDKQQSETALPVLLKEVRDNPEVSLCDSLLYLLEFKPNLLTHFETPPTLVKLLASQDTGVQNKSYRLLSGMKVGKEAAPQLSQLLESSDPKTRLYATLLLGEIKSVARNLLPNLRRLLEDSSTLVRLAAAIAILKLESNDESAREVLHHAVNDPEASTRIDVAKTILLHMDSSDVRAIQIIRNDFKKVTLKERDILVLDLRRHVDRLDKPDRLVSLLGEYLRDPDSDVRLKAATILEELGPKALPAIPNLVVALDDSYEPVRKSAVRALRAIGQGAHSAADALASRLPNDTDSYLGHEIAAALVQVNSGDKRGCKYLSQALRSWKSESRIHALERISYIDPIPEELILALVKVVQSDSAGTPRYLAALSLARSISGNRDHIVPCLVKASKDPHDRVRRVAIQALAMSKDESQTVIRALTEAVQDEDYEVRLAAIDGLGSKGAGSESAVPALVRLLSDLRGSIRERAALALGKIGSQAKGAIPALTRASQDPDKRVQKAALTALGMIRRE